ncbi:membrane-bound ClpP family serine protease [Paraburkholderia bryophila]|uniref:Membrane-bound ClpP family serine protease n=4 Tax=Paraburkholderia TaxID=1822464 RepID=A0A7Y9W639_9BURK|nr:membrane-bound ClpP family serine protease [Paraburkholderia bryophila]
MLAPVHTVTIATMHSFLRVTMSRFFAVAAAVWGIGGCVALLVGLLFLGAANSFGAALTPYVGGGLMALVGVLGLIAGLIAAVWPSSKKKAARGEDRPWLRGDR